MLQQNTGTFCINLNFPSNCSQDQPLPFVKYNLQLLLNFRQHCKLANRIKPKKIF